jgi:hypothetical protein
MKTAFEIKELLKNSISAHLYTSSTPEYQIKQQKLLNLISCSNPHNLLILNLINSLVKDEDYKPKTDEKERVTLEEFVQWKKENYNLPMHQ